MIEYPKSVWGSSVSKINVRLGLATLAVAVAVGAFACAGAKAPAEQAVGASDSALANVSAEASKYVPEELRSAQDTLASAKASLEHGDYQAALTSAQQIPGKVSALQTAIAAKKAELTKTWESMGGVSQMVDTLKARVATLSSARKLPAGISADVLADAKTGVATLNQAWADAMTAAQSGNIADAVAKGSAVKEQAAKLMASLHVSTEGQTK